MPDKLWDVRRMPQLSAATSTQRQSAAGRYQQWLVSPLRCHVGGLAYAGPGLVMEDRMGHSRVV